MMHSRRAGSRVAGCAGAFLAALALGAPAASASETDWTTLRAMNIAHQGGENEAPSNTMYSYERAMRLGADMLEVDIHTSVDGDLVVLHDATVNRTTNGSGRVYDMTLEQIQALDSAHNFVPGLGTRSGRPETDYPFRGIRTGDRRPPRGFEPDDFRIPALDEVIQAYPGVPLNIEIKGAADNDVDSFLRNAEALAAYLNKLGRSDGIIVASFNDAALQRFHELAPQIDLAPAVAGVAAYKLSRTPPPAGTVAFQVPTEFGGVAVADPEFVQNAHADGYVVHIWTINDPEEMVELLGWGTDGIMTAEPMRLEQVLCEGGYPRPERPASFVGEHCSGKASIACEIEPTRAKRKGKRLKVTLRRYDEFEGRCAGELTALTHGARSRAGFDFGEEPPAEGGPGKRRASIKLTDEMRRKIKQRKQVKLIARPYDAFPGRDRVGVG